MARSRPTEDDDDDGEQLPKAKKFQRKNRPNVEEPKAVNGEIVPTSKVKLFGLFLFGALFTILCGFFLFDGFFIGEAKTVLPFRLSWWGYILSVVGLLIGIVCIIAGPFGILFPTQLVLGKNFFQEQRKTGGVWKVILQIPYDNIRDVSFVKNDDDSYVCFQFRDARDPDTYCADETAFETAEKKGCSYALTGMYSRSLKVIADDIENRVDGQEEEEDD